MSDANICSNNKKYGGFGAAMANSLHCWDHAAPARAVAANSTAPAHAMAAARGPGKKKSPPVTVINKAVTSSGKHVTNYIMLAAARAPVKKVVPAMPVLDVVPAPVFLDNPQMRAAAEAVMVEEPVHLPGILVEIVGTQMSCQGRLCKKHEMCGDDALKEDVMVRLRTVQLMVEGKEEKAIAVVWVSYRIDCCHVGFLPCHMVKSTALYNGALAQVTRVFNGNPADWDSAECHAYHKNKGYTHAVIILDLPLAPRFGLFG